MRSRLSICYAAPGHTLVSTAGSARNILSLAEALSHWADVTVAFRSICEPVKTGRINVVSIEPREEAVGARMDDVAARGLNPLSHLAYVRLLKSFAQQWARSFDVVLEKGWRLSGTLAALFRAQGVPGLLVENDVRYWHEPIRGVRAMARYAMHGLAQGVAGYASRRMPLIIAETDELKTMLIQQRHIAAEQVEVIGLGVDHRLFYPMTQDEARRALGICSEACVLLYVGGLDMYHDLGPLLQACSQAEQPELEIHIVGNGEYRSNYEAKARQTRVPVVFHGQQPHHRVPTFIGASDLCLAPYRVDAFPNQLVPFSTLKIPEYMACARPVVSVPSGHIQTLIEDQQTGFLVPNAVSAWHAFLRQLPDRHGLAAMGTRAAHAVASVSWENTAAQYLEASRSLIASRD